MASLQRAIVLFLFVFNGCQAWIEFYEEVNFKGLLHNYTEKSSAYCVDFAKEARLKLKSLKTDRCFWIYFGENCTGGGTGFMAGQKSNLYSNNDKAISFRYCSPAETIRKEFAVTFYSSLNSFEGGFGYQTISSSCVTFNRPEQNRVQSLKTERCILLFSQEQCKGESLEIKAGRVTDLQSFNNKTVSFRGCQENKDEIKYRVKFYGKESFQEILYDRDIYQSCYSKHSNFPIYSLVTPVCLIFFSDYSCGREKYLSMVPSGSHLTLFNEIDWKEVKSFRPCSDTGDVGTSTGSMTSVAFYDDANLKSVLFVTIINSSCQSLPQLARNRTESVKTTKCIILFPSEDCNRNLPSGCSLKILPNQGKFLPNFANVAQSFQTCASYEAKSTNHVTEDLRSVVRFYCDASENITKPVASEVLAPNNKCKNLSKSVAKKVSSVVSDRCLTLYEEENCFGRNFTLRPHYGVKLDEHFNHMAASFNACTNFISKKKELPMENLFDLPSIQFYENENFTDLLLDAPIREICLTPRNKFWSRAYSIKTESCVVLYNLPYCQGSSIRFLPGSELSPSFYNKVTSFTACEENEEENESQLSGSTTSADNTIETNNSEVRTCNNDATSSTILVEMDLLKQKLQNLTMVMKRICSLEGNSSIKDCSGFISSKEVAEEDYNDFVELPKPA